jgi:CubicO group peptidase (beta-lactamase class C family)
MKGSTKSDAAHRVIAGAIAARIFPAAVIEVGSSERVLDHQAFGTLTFAEGAPVTEIHTPFDLASLTKVVATTTAVMHLVAEGRLRLDDPVANFFEEWRGEDRQDVTIVDLLEHASGLAARLVDPPGSGRREFEHDISTMRLEYVPRTRSIYSDLGFILLGFAAADQLEPPTLESVVSLFSRTGDPLTFNLSPEDVSRAAPTVPLDTDSRRGRLLAGEVHDNYAAALGGTAGHAGLFGTAHAVGAFAQTMLRAAHGDASVPPAFNPAIVARFVTRSAVAGSSRALGWDTMLPTSSCGTRMSSSAFGHVGYTGTSLWIDPARDRYFVLLTNRACGGGTLDQMRDVRRAFHDALEI